MQSRSMRALALALLLMTIGHPARAVIVVTGTAGNYTVSQIFTSSTTYTGSTYNGSGAQFEGQWSDGAGTIVGPHQFLTATHLGGSDGSVFKFGGTNYTAVSSTDVGNGMTLWTVGGPAFTNYAQIYANNYGTSSSVMGKMTSDFGYGVAPNLNAPVTGPDGTQGYVWSTSGSGGKLSWGASSVENYFSNPSGGDFYGTNLLGMAFLPSLGTGTMSSTLALDDSGGGLFADINGKWMLVGVNFGVDGPYSTSPTGSNQFNAAVFDQTGLYVSNGMGGYVLATPDDPTLTSNPQFSFADAITPTVANGILSVVPEPASMVLLGIGSALGAMTLARRSRRADARPSRLE